MRSGVTLATLRREVAIEAGFSTDAGHAAYSQERINHLINRTERLMAIQDGWPAMSFEETLTVPALGQFANLPVNITFTQITGAFVLYGQDWIRLSHGISPADRSLYAAGQTGAPMQKWEVQAPGTVNFEVWPIAEYEQTMRFTGQRTIGAMVTDDDTCALDGDVIVLKVAAEILGRDRKEDAALKLDLAKSLTVDILKLQGSVKSEEIIFGRNTSEPRPRPGIDFIPRV